MDKFYLTITEDEKYLASTMEQYISPDIDIAWERAQEFMGDACGEGQFKILLIDTKKGTSEDVTEDAELKFAEHSDDYDSPDQHHLGAFEYGVGRYA